MYRNIAHVKNKYFIYILNCLSKIKKMWSGVDQEGIVADSRRGREPKF